MLSRKPIQNRGSIESRVVKYTNIVIYILDVHMYMFDKVICNCLHRVN